MIRSSLIDGCSFSLLGIVCLVGHMNNQKIFYNHNLRCFIICLKTWRHPDMVNFTTNCYDFQRRSCDTGICAYFVRRWNIDIDSFIRFNFQYLNTSAILKPADPESPFGN